MYNSKRSFDKTNNLLYVNPLYINYYKYIQVGPRTPLQRLESLVRFSQEWLDANLSNLASYESWKNRFVKNSERMMKAFKRETCGFFDPTIPHGGPNPNPKKRRNRRKRSNGRGPGLGSQYFQGQDGVSIRRSKKSQIVKSHNYG